tara:strand:- start:386 stop:712 length:327 start_codon:yes stop_codon:yes gene_type:complete
MWRLELKQVTGCLIKNSNLHSRKEDMKYVISRANPECVCSLNGCPNEEMNGINVGCLNRLVLLDDDDNMQEFNSLSEAYESLSVHIPTGRLNEELKDKIISIDPMEFE